MKRNILLLLFAALIFSACTSSQQTTDQKPKEQEIYVFDDANVKNIKDTVKAAEQKTIAQAPLTPAEKEVPVIKGTEYIVQLGAFSTKEKAEK